jgi:hypothetical protein
MSRRRGLFIRLSALTLVLSAVFSGSARAAVTENDKISFDGFTMFVPCANGGAGEFVVFTGNLHVLTTFTINGNNVSGKYHFQPEGLTGVGQTTGDKYHGTGGTQGTFKGSLQNGQYQQTDVNNFRLIGQGPGNNFLVHDVVHTTINANGTVSTVVDQHSVDCK